MLQLINTVSNEKTSCSHHGNTKRRHARQASYVHFAVFSNEPNYSNLSALQDTIRNLFKNYTVHQNDFGPSELLNLLSVGMIAHPVPSKCSIPYFSDACKCSATNSSIPEVDGVRIIDDTACIGSPVSPCAHDNSIRVRYTIY